MNKNLILLVCFIFLSCNFNANMTYDNEESEKENAEEVAALFYFYVQRNEVDKTMDLLSGSFFKVTNVATVKEFLNSNHNNYGVLQDFTLRDWKTRRITGTKAESNYVLIYNVKYARDSTIEKITLTREKGHIKICGYDVQKTKSTIPIAIGTRL